MTITGANFTGVKEVKFRSTTATSYTVVSATSIIAEAPAHSAGKVTVTTAAGKSVISDTDDFTYLALPTVTKVEPHEGPATGGRK
jgi:hypothetical protein